MEEDLYAGVREEGRVLELGLVLICTIEKRGEFGEQIKEDINMISTTSISFFSELSSQLVSQDLLTLFYDILIIATITGVIAGLVHRVSWWLTR